MLQNLSLVFEVVHPKVRNTLVTFVIDFWTAADALLKASEYFGLAGTLGGLCPKQHPNSHSKYRRTESRPHVSPHNLNPGHVTSVFKETSKTFFGHKQFFNDVEVTSHLQAAEFQHSYSVLAMSKMSALWLKLVRMCTASEWLEFIMVCRLKFHCEC